MVDIKELFKDLQNEMLASFKTNKNISHHPTNGAANETLWINWAKKYLAKRYTADSAFIIDYKGNQSEQQDLVIYDCQYTPFILNKGGCKYITAESVYAVFELKPTLNKENIEYARSKIQSVRKLIRTSADIYHAGGKYCPKESHHIIGGIITHDVVWKDGLGKTFKKHINSSLYTESRIDIGISLSDGAFKINYDETNPIISVSNSENSLITFFFDLCDMLQKCGTVPAIDIQKYANNL